MCSVHNNLKTEQTFFQVWSFWYAQILLQKNEFLFSVPSDHHLRKVSVLLNVDDRFVEQAIEFACHAHREDLVVSVSESNVALGGMIARHASEGVFVAGVHLDLAAARVNPVRVRALRVLTTA